MSLFTKLRRRLANFAGYLPKGSLGEGKHGLGWLLQPLQAHLNVNSARAPNSGHLTFLPFCASIAYVIYNRTAGEALLNKASLAEQVYEVLRQRIIDLEIKPGEKINVRQLEEEFEVSQAPIRDALQRLASEGLVRIEPRVGYFAIRLSAKDVKDIYCMRKLFELYALRGAITKIPRSELENLYQETTFLLQEELPEASLKERIDRTDYKLHQELIIGSSENRLFQAFTARIASLTAITMHLSKRPKEALKEHLTLIEALMRRDLAAAEAALKLHLDNVEKAILAELEGEFVWPEEGKTLSVKEVRDAESALRGR
jgi:DNA-binding GntR family transcriptional regulator